MLMDKTDARRKTIPLRVLQVTGGMNIGGAETMIMSLYRKIDRSKVQFDFISFSREKCHFDKEILALGGRIFYLPPPGATNPIRFIAGLRRIIKENGPYHAVHAHTLFNSGLVLTASRLAGVRLRVCHAHNTSGDHGRVFIRKIYFVIMRLLIKMNTNKNVACTKAAGRFLFGKNTVSGKKFVVLNNAIDLNPYRNADPDKVFHMRRTIGAGENTLVLGHVGRFGEQKNHVFLLRLAEYLRAKEVDFKLVLIGDGNLRQKIEQEAKDKGLTEHVKFLGIQTNIHLYMRMFDVFVFPSLYEGLGIVLIEAQAAGTPCVISDTVPDESDMGLGLIRKINLKESLDVWCEAVISSSKIERISPEVAIDAILKNGYDLNSTVKVLERIYELPGI